MFFYLFFVSAMCDPKTEILFLFCFTEFACLSGGPLSDGPMFWSPKQGGQAPPPMSLWHWGQGWSLVRQLQFHCSNPTPPPPTPTEKLNQHQQSKKELKICATRTWKIISKKHNFGESLMFVCLSPKLKLADVK